MRQRERLPRRPYIGAICDIIWMWHQYAVRFLRSSADCLRFGILGDIDGCRFRNDVLEQTIKELRTILDG